jgi:predicted ATPase
MITKIFVDGFRSLKRFSLELHPGLNILVGPNGGGKTNIISFFEFLSYIVNFGSSEAINKLGGAGSVFSKRDDESGEFQHQILVEIIGSAKKGNDIYINYQYNFKLNASSDFNEIIFSEQEIKILNNKEFNPNFSMGGSAFTIKKTIIESEPKYLVKNYIKEYVESSFLQFVLGDNKKKGEEAIVQFLKNFLDNNELSLIPIISHIYDERNLIYEDLCSGQVFNFIPSKIKMPEDTSSSAGIQKDGSGLAATLYAIQKNENTENKRTGAKRTIILGNKRRETYLAKIKIDDILKYIRTANQSIIKITVDNDRFENLLKIKFSVIENGKQITLPITSMSDGTIKWLSFITSVLTSPTVFSIEEPENYLHPLMQGEVVKLMRNSIENNRYLSTILMSTHSETILNQARPEEIIITEYINGATVAKHCSNPDDISEEIKNTGFGVGYYYISGSLEYE